MEKIQKNIMNVDGPKSIRRRHAVDDGGDPIIKCSGQHCRACTAGMIADCVAICCCPCALVNLLTLALFKVPWKVGRRCLGLGKKKRKEKLRMKCSGEMGDGSSGDRDGNSGKRGVEEGMFGIGEEEEIMGSFSGTGRHETEEVWLELYQVGHLGFGRVSFTGIQ